MLQEQLRGRRTLLQRVRANLPDGIATGMSLLQWADGQERDFSTRPAGLVEMTGGERYRARHSDGGGSAADWRNRLARVQGGCTERDFSARRQSRLGRDDGVRGVSPEGWDAGAVRVGSAKSLLAFVLR